MDHDQPARPSAGAMLATVGGIVAAVGALLAWAKITSTLAGVQVAGQEIPESSISQSAAGTSHWTGILALAGGIVGAGGGVATLFAQDRVRRALGVVALLGGILAIGMAAAGFALKDQIAASLVPGGIQALRASERFAEGLTPGFERSVAIGFGVFVTALGGLAAALGGLLVWLRPTVAAPAEAPGFSPPAAPEP